MNVFSPSKEMDLKILEFNIFFSVLRFSVKVLTIIGDDTVNETDNQKLRNLSVREFSSLIISFNVIV